MIVTVYIDESGTHDSGYTILGGWVGRLGQWAGFDPKWDKLLKRSELTYFFILRKGVARRVNSKAGTSDVNKLSWAKRQRWR